MFPRAMLPIAALVFAVPAFAQRLPDGQGQTFRHAMLDWQGAAADERRASVEMERPLDARRYSSTFGQRYDARIGMQRLHAGVDIPSPFGTSVRASADGVVVRASWAGGYGNLVEVRHEGGIVTRYGHLSTIFVLAGSPVARGDVVGLVGSTGHSTGNHLHFEVRLDGRPVDPLNALANVTLPGGFRDTPEVGARWSWVPAEKPEVLPMSVVR